MINGLVRGKASKVEVTKLSPDRTECTEYTEYRQAGRAYWQAYWELTTNQPTILPGCHCGGFACVTLTRASWGHVKYGIACFKKETFLKWTDSGCLYSDSAYVVCRYEGYRHIAQRTSNQAPLPESVNSILTIKKTRIEHSLHEKSRLVWGRIWKVKAEGKAVP